MSMLEHDAEPSPGIPQELPDGERVLWQGPARFKRLALSTFHVRKLAVYFAAIISASVVYGLSGTAAAAETFAQALTFTLLAASSLGLLTAYAWLVARATMYTITNKRIVVRTGVAVPVTVNLPFSRIERASLRRQADGSGDIAIVPDGSGRASYILLWPMVRPFRWVRVQPVIRGIDDAEAVATLLAAELRARSDTPAPRPADPRPAPAVPKTGKRKLLTYPTLPLTAAVSLVVVALVAVGFGQLVGGGDVGPDGPAPTVAVQLYFDDQDDGSIVVTNAGNGERLDVLAPGSNGFLRSAMRTFVQARRTTDAGREVPFLLAQMPNGQLILSDPATDRYIDLRAFGPTNAEAFGRFLELAEEPIVGAGETPSRDARASATTVALSNQEVNP